MRLIEQFLSFKTPFNNSTKKFNFRINNCSGTDPIKYIASKFTLSCNLSSLIGCSKSWDNFLLNRKLNIQLKKIFCRIRIQDPTGWKDEQQQISKQGQFQASSFEPETSQWTFTTRWMPLALLQCCCSSALYCHANVSEVEFEVTSSQAKLIHKGIFLQLPSQGGTWDL